MSKPPLLPTQLAGTGTFAQGFRAQLLLPTSTFPHLPFFPSTIRPTSINFSRAETLDPVLAPLLASLRQNNLRWILDPTSSFAYIVQAISPGTASSCTSRSTPRTEPSAIEQPTSCYRYLDPSPAVKDIQKACYRIVRTKRYRHWYVNRSSPHQIRFRCSSCFLLLSYR